MKRTSYLFLLLLLFIKGTSQTKVGLEESVQESIFKDKYFVESGIELIHTARKVKQGLLVSDADWEHLFQTVGYHKYFATKRGPQMKEWIKEAILISFSDERKREADSIAVISMDLNSSTLIPTLITQNFQKLSNRMDEIEEFLYNTDWEAILEQAHQKCKAFLPERAYKSRPELNDIYIIGTLPDANVRGKSIFMDLSILLDFSREELINLLAHEFHHNYRDMIIPGGSIKDPLLKIIDSMHAEGVADLIDKKGIPFTHLSSYSSEMLEAYTQDFLNTPDVLMVIDSIAQAYIKGQSDDNAYAKLNNRIKFGGHTNGFYMVLAIKDQGKFQDVIDSYDDPVAFIALYNEVARQMENQYVFSPDFIGYLEQLWRDYLTGSGELGKED